MKSFNRPLIVYTAWLCRILTVGPDQIQKAQARSGGGFVPRPEGALGFYY
jgi:hypothetical protein